MNSQSLSSHDQILSELHKLPELEQLPSLVALNDLIEGNDWDIKQTERLAHLLLSFYFNHPFDVDAVKISVHRCLVNLLLETSHRLSATTYQPLLQVLQKSQAVKEICPALNLLAHSFDRQFASTIHRFTKHSNSLIADCAKQSLNLLQTHQRY